MATGTIENGTEVYSSNETVAGFWNGTPLYRKVYTKTLNGTDVKIDNFLPTGATLRKMTGIARGSEYQYETYYKSTGDCFVLIYLPGTNQLGIQKGSSAPPTGSVAEIIVEYTKA